jgi:hypothetical protein
MHILITHAYILQLWGAHRWDVAVDNNKWQGHSRGLQSHSQELHGCAWAGQLLHVLSEPFMHQDNNPHPLHSSSSWFMKDAMAGECNH